MTVLQDVQSPYVEGVIDLFELEYKDIIFRVTPFTGDSLGINWRDGADTFLPFPILIEDVSDKSNGVAPSPTITISNISKVFAGLVFSAGNMAGAKITRWRIQDRYRYGQPSYDAANVSNQYLSKHVFTVRQTESLTAFQFTLSLTNSLDRPTQLTPIGRATSERFPGITRLDVL